MVALSSFPDYLRRTITLYKTLSDFQTVATYGEAEQPEREQRYEQEQTGIKIIQKQTAREN